jgi:hypothetical protein
MLFWREWHGRFILRPGQPEDYVGDVVLRVLGKGARNCERSIEKFCHGQTSPTHRDIRKLMLLLAHASPGSPLMPGDFGFALRVEIVEETAAHDLAGPVRGHLRLGMF